MNNTENTEDIIDKITNLNAKLSALKLVDQQVVQVEKELKTQQKVLAQEIKKHGIVDPILERLDPTPDIQELWKQFDKKFFKGVLGKFEGGFQVKWSHQMFVCSGITHYNPPGPIKINLSAKLLKSRTRRELVEILLHEMIHAYLFATNDSDSGLEHGPQYISLMHKINEKAGTKISEFNNLNDSIEGLREEKKLKAEERKKKLAEKERKLNGDKLESLEAVDGNKDGKVDEEKDVNGNVNEKGSKGNDAKSVATSVKKTSEKVKEKNTNSK